VSIINEAKEKQAMRRITKAAMALGAILALGVVFAGGAQAHTFLWTGTTPALLLILADGVQTFTAEPGGGQVQCKHARFDGKVQKEAQETQTVVGTYTGCTAFGLAAKVSTAEYELNANETVSVINKTIVIEVPTAACKIEIEPNARNKNLSKIRYLVDPNSGGTRLLAHAEVEKIHSIIVGGGTTCGQEGLHTEGVYRGLLLAWVDAAGTLSWS
jgi:hypothetical protein